MPAWFLAVAFAVAVGAFGFLAHAVVDGGRLVEADLDVAGWVASEMPTWAEWVARPLTWLGGAVGVTVVIVVTAVFLIRSRRPDLAVLVVTVAVGAQALVAVTKQGYERARPDAGSAVDLPSSFAFPSGHATTGIAVFGLLGVIVAGRSRTRRAASTAIAAGLVLGVAIGASRIVLNVHYFTDVVAGLSLGLAWLSICLLVYNVLQR